MPNRLRITEQDIVDVERHLNVCFDDPNRRGVIQCSVATDIQACPGSGKTTVLVSKIALLASKWSWNNRGICVLSHTNAARREVEKRLTTYPAARALLSYPHFVGTIQTFVNRFLALPALREKGIEVRAIDDDIFARAILARLPRNIRFGLERSRNESAAETVRYSGPNLLLVSSGKLPSVASETYKALCKAKAQLTNEGILRYDDMYAFASEYLSRHAWVASALRHRFPWVFIDEMQDTDAVQDILIRESFGACCIIQRFGDCNQAIFRGVEVDSQSSFPAPGYRSIPDSRRFGNEIAKFATPLTRAVTPQDLVGTHITVPRRHTLFLFDPGTIRRVLPAFGALLETEFRQGLPSGFIAKAIGFRKTRPTDGEAARVPFSIGHYYSGFNPRIGATSDRPKSFIDFVRKARSIRNRDGECKEASDLVLDGIVELLEIEGVTDANGKRFTKSRLSDSLAADIRSLMPLRGIVAHLILTGWRASSSSWQATVDNLIAALRPLLPTGICREGRQFLEWNDIAQMLPTYTDCESDAETNVYRHRCSMGTINIELSTIHAAKGQTHTATLVLETFDKAHDLKSILKFLKGSTASANLPVKHMKRVFVAMTRPRELLCLAMLREHVSATDSVAMASRGWTITDLTNSI
jgi:hypothetical protein